MTGIRRDRKTDIGSKPKKKKKKIGGLKIRPRSGVRPRRIRTETVPRWQHERGREFIPIARGTNIVAQRNIPKGRDQIDQETTGKAAPGGDQKIIKRIARSRPPCEEGPDGLGPRSSARAVRAARNSRWRARGPIAAPIPRPPCEQETAVRVISAPPGSETHHGDVART